jgi:hypothetical protein
MLSRKSSCTYPNRLAAWFFTLSMGAPNAMRIRNALMQAKVLCYSIMVIEWRNVCHQLLAVDRVIGFNPLIIIIL